MEDREYGTANSMKLECRRPGRVRYMYIDSAERRADRLFVRSELPVSFEDDLAKPSFTTSDFNLFAKLYGMKDDQRYSTNTNMGSESAWYAYSQQAIDDIFAVLKANPSGAIDEAKQALSKKKEAFDDRPQEQGNSKP